MVEPQRIFCSFLKAEVEQVNHFSGQRANDQWPLTYWLGLRESMQLPDTRVGSQRWPHLCSEVPRITIPTGGRPVADKGPARDEFHSALRDPPSAAERKTSATLADEAWRGGDLLEVPQPGRMG